MIKEVRLTDKANYGCTVDRVTGKFLIDIRGQVANIRDFSIPDDLTSVSIQASGQMFCSLLCQEAFAEFRHLLEKKYSDASKIKFNERK
ncbi:MAG: hypothetical protein PHV82_12120 [Victivallaceae bacterium]|nr:hypothetical protein [Victivallaceae bacterium]